MLGVGVKCRDADTAIAPANSAHAPRYGRRVEQIRLDDHARAQHARHSAPDEASGNHLADLVPDGDALPCVEQLADVLRDRLMRHAAHRQPARSAETATGQLHAEDRCRDLARPSPNISKKSPRRASTIASGCSALTARYSRRMGVFARGLRGRALCRGASGTAATRCGARTFELVLTPPCRPARPATATRSRRPPARCAARPADAVPAGSHATLFSRVRPYGLPSSAMPSTRISTLWTRRTARCDAAAISRCTASRWLSRRLLLRQRHVVLAAGRGSPGADRVRGEMHGVETQLAHQRFGAGELCVGLAAEPDDDVGAQREARTDGVHRSLDLCAVFVDACRAGASAGAGRRHRPAPGGATARRQSADRASPRTDSGTALRGCDVEESQPPQPGNRIDRGEQLGEACPVLPGRDTSSRSARAASPRAPPARPGARHARRPRAADGSARGRGRTGTMQ